MADVDFFQKCWGELADSNGVVEDLPRALTDDWLKGVRQRVAAGELPPGFVTIDPEVALNRINRQEFYQAFVGRALKKGKWRVREFVPVIAGDRSEITPIPIRSWAATSSNQGYAITHARSRINDHMLSAAKLHGATLVAAGETTWEQLAQDGSEQWRLICQEMMRLEGEKAS